MKGILRLAGSQRVALGAALAASFVVSLQEGEKSLEVNLADKDFIAALDSCAAHPRLEKMEEEPKSSELVPATEADIAGALTYTLTEKQAAARDLAKLLSVVQAVDEKIKPSTSVLDADQRDALARMLISTSLSAELRRNLCIFAKVVEANQDRLEEGSPWIKQRLETVAELIKGFGVEVVVKSDGVESKVVQDMKEWSTRYDNASDLLTALRKNTERYEAPTPEGFKLPQPVAADPKAEEKKAEGPAAETTVEVETPPACEASKTSAAAENTAVVEEATENTAVVEEATEHTAVVEAATEHTAVVAPATENTAVVEEATENTPVVEEATENTPVVAATEEAAADDKEAPASVDEQAPEESKPRCIVLVAPSFTSVKGTAYNESVAPYYHKMSMGLLADTVAPLADAPFREPTLAPRDLAVADAA